LRKGGTAEEKDDGEREGERPMQVVVSHKRLLQELLSSSLGIEVCDPRKLGVAKTDEMAHQRKTTGSAYRRKHGLKSLPSKIDDCLFLFANR
jgi:hypothetical protein